MNDLASATDESTTVTRPADSGSFAKLAPRALGAFSANTELLDSAESNGWSVRGRRLETLYDGSAAGPLYGVTSIKDVVLRRRPLDGFSLQAQAFQQFEEDHPDYFPFSYDYRCKSGDADSCYEQILRLAVEEFGELDFLQPLASAIQMLDSSRLAPFITRCWDFGSKPAALIKTATMRHVESGEEIRGACICYQPPTRRQLLDNTTNHLLLRSVVAHEIGHQWWNAVRDDPPKGLRDIDDKDGDLLEQIAGLFSVFLILYRGYWDRKPHSREQLERAFDKLDFETEWAKRRRQQIIDDVLGLCFPSRAFNPADEPRPEIQPEPTKRLGETAILAIREAARSIACKARPIPFASAAAVVGMRKIDYFLKFELTDADEWPSWQIEDVRAEHIDPRRYDVESQWRHVHFKVPRPAAGADALDLKKSLEIAREIANLRLYGRRFADASLLQSKDMERTCSATERDLARILALALYVQSAQKRARKLKPCVAKLLLHHDPANLGYLDKDFAYYFQWCCLDTDDEEAEDRFLAEIKDVGKTEVHFTMEQEDGLQFGGSLPKSRFLQAQFTEDELRPGTEFKLFGSAGRLRPFSYRRAAES